MSESNTRVEGGAHSANWVIPADHPSLGLHEVHIWKIGLLAGPAELDQLRTLLPADEMARADRLKFDRHCRRFITGRAVMRILLGRYASRAPESLEFSYNAHGKPSLRDASSLTFNFTNSRDLALLCIAREQQLGIDLEHLGRHANYAGIVNRFFAGREIEELSAIPESRRQAAFLTGWTRKEAYIKALGTGLSLPLDRFAVRIDPDLPPALVQVDAQPNELSRWTFVSLAPGSGYVATLVAEGSGQTVKHYDWRV